MAGDNRTGQEGKRSFPGSFFLFLLVAVLIAVTVQSFLGTKYAKVSFSYQVQHLVNLQLIVPQDSRMVALGDNLVTFSGRFRDRPTDEGKKRYKYLQLLFSQHQAQEKQQALQQELAQERRGVEAAGAKFLEISGLAVPGGGYVVVAAEAIPEGEEPIVVYAPSHTGVISLRQLQDQLQNVQSQPTNEGIKELGVSLSSTVQNFRASALGIGSEEIKQELQTLEQQVRDANSQETGTAHALGLHARSIGQLQTVVTQLDEEQNGVRLGQLRAVRHFTRTADDYSTNLGELETVNAQLDKARPGVASVVWYFNNQEVSTRALERQDPEIYDQWFLQAKTEWEEFNVNKGLPFRAVDQPRNIVLDRNFKAEAPSPNYLSYLMPILLVGGVVLLLYFLFARQMRGMGGGAMSFGKSPAKMFAKGMTNITFKDVAGADEAKEELQEIIDFLKNPAKFTALGGRIPKGVLCVGPPGTGKTLIAKAVAGEANRPFFSISGSDFVEMFVGVGASRIRDLFDQAKKNAPCIVFIDEIDAVGRHRGAGIGGGHDEREQTLNQLLVEMDGFDTNEGVILIAATNRPDVLDKALLRPGRFDRRVVIGLPDLKGRYEILKVHARKIKIASDVDLMAIARSTPGASGADLENLLNEAALLAARKGRTAVTAEETYEARDKVRYGVERRSLELDEEEKRTTAYHESGHAIVGLMCEHADPVDKVTIIPRGFSLGATHFLPEKNRLNLWKKELLDQLAVAMGGRAAEEVFIGDLSAGAQQDFSQATQIARSMVCEWGMSDKLGRVSYDSRSETGLYMGLPGYQEKSYSEETARAIDEEIRTILDEAYNRARKIILDNKDHVELMAQMLMEFETLDSEDIKKIVSGTWNPEEKRAKLKRIAELHRKQPTKSARSPGESESSKSDQLPEPA
jgi:cell division protease FtsH